MLEERDSKKRGLSIFEKSAVFIIIILVIVILLLVFNKQIREYWDIFRAWYGSA